MVASDWSTPDHVITVEQSEAPRAPVSRFYSRPFLRRYFGGDWKPGSLDNNLFGINGHIRPFKVQISKVNFNMRLT